MSEPFPDCEDLKAYRQLSDDLRAFEVVMMHHFFKKDSTKQRRTFADSVRASLEKAYEKNCPKDPRNPQFLDCGPYCPDGKLCRPC